MKSSQRSTPPRSSCRSTIAGASADAAAVYSARTGSPSVARNVTSSAAGTSGGAGVAVTTGVGAGVLAAGSSPPPHPASTITAATQTPRAIRAR